MRNEKLEATTEEETLSYVDLLRELGSRFLRDPKRFKAAVNRVSDLLSEEERSRLRALNRGRESIQAGDFEDRFEEICWAKHQDEKRELVRLLLRHM